MATVHTAASESSSCDVRQSEVEGQRNTRLTSEWLFAGLLLCGYAPLVIEHFQNLWRYRPHYEFAPCIALSIALLLWQRWPAAPITHSYLVRQFGMLLISAGVTLLAVSVMFYSPHLAMIAFAFSLAGLLLWLGGVSGLRDLLPVWCLIWLTVPPPWGMDQLLMRTLQGFTSRTCSLLLDLFQVPHILQGNVIRLPNRELFVAEACSGVHSQLVLLACAALLVVLRRRSLVFAVVLLASSIFWATVANTARVLMVSVALGLWGIDLSEGWRHEVMGYSVVLVGLLMLLSTDRLLDGLFAPILVEGLPPDDPLSHHWNQLIATPGVAFELDSELDREWEPLFETSGDVPVWDPSPPGLASWCLIAVCVILGLVQAAVLVRREFPSSPETKRLDLPAAQSAFAELDLPEQNGAWKRVSASTEDRKSLAVVNGFSRIWVYGRENQLARVAIDYPFDGWHELTTCYQAIGWEVVSREVLGTQVEASAARSDMHVEVELRNAAGEFGHLCFSLCDDRGSSLAPHEQQSTFHIVKQKLGRSPIFSLMGLTSWSRSMTPLVLQTQQFCVSPIPFTPEEKSSLRANFLGSRDQLWQDLKRQN